MNIHHLELFYFVAKHGGIAAAVRNIPYGIQQPAVSGQIAKLEESPGTKLFQLGDHSRSRQQGPSFFSLFDRSSKISMSLAKGCARTVHHNCVSRLRQSCFTITCRKSCNAFGQNSRCSGCTCPRPLAVRPNDCFWLAKSILGLC